MRWTALAAIGVAVLLGWQLLASSSTPRTGRSPRADKAPPTTTTTTTTTATTEATRSDDAASTDSETEPWRVRLVTRSGLPIPGVPVRFTDARENEVHQDKTNAEGWAASPRPAAVANAFPFVRGACRLRGKSTTIRADLLPLEVVLRDIVSDAVVRGGEITLGHDDWPFRKIRDGRMEVAPILAGWTAYFQLKVLPPEGYSAPGYIVVNEGVSRMATRMRIEIPLGPEIRQRIRVLDGRGYPVEGARAVRVESAFSELPFAAEPSDRAGWLELRRLPYVPRYTVTASAAGEYGTVDFLRGTTDAVVVRLGPVDHGEVDIEEELIEVEEDEMTAPPAGPFRLAVECLRADGRPAAGVAVDLCNEDHRVRRFADARGIAVFDRLPDGLFRAQVDDPAFRSPTVEVSARDGRVRLHEPAGRTVALRVVPSIPFLQLRGVPPRVVDGVQVAGVFTDLSGRVTLVDVPVEAFPVYTDRGRFKVPENVVRHESRLR